MNDSYNKGFLINCTIVIMHNSNKENSFCNKLELCHWRDVYPHMLHWHRIFCMLSHKTREAYLWQFLRIIMPLSFMAILTFEILNSLAWYAIQCLWTKLMWRVILNSHKPESWLWEIMNILYFWILDFIFDISYQNTFDLKHMCGL